MGTMNVEVTEVVRAWNLTRVFASVGERRFELTTFREGPVEVYEIDTTDGIAMFKGYLVEQKGRARAVLTLAWVKGCGASLVHLAS